MLLFVKKTERRRSVRLTGGGGDGYNYLPVYPISRSDWLWPLSAAARMILRLPATKRTAGHHIQLELGQTFVGFL